MESCREIFDFRLKLQVYCRKIYSNLFMNIVLDFFFKFCSHFDLEIFKIYHNSFYIWNFYTQLAIWYPSISESKYNQIYLFPIFSNHMCLNKLHKITISTKLWVAKVKICQITSCLQKVSAGWKFHSVILV